MVKSVGSGLNTSQHRLWDDARVRSDIIKEFSGKKVSKHSDAARTNFITAFAAPGAKSADFEEMTFMMQKTMESKMKSLSRRRFSTTEGVDLWGAKEGHNQRIQDIEKLRKIYEQLDNSYTQDHLKKQAGHIYKLASKGQTFEFNNDSIPAGSYIWLKEAESIAISKNDKNAQQYIQNKLEELDKKSGRKVDAGLNTAEIFKNAYGDSSKRNMLRTLYCNNIMALPDIQSLRIAIKNFDNDMTSTADNLTRAVLADINASRSSSDHKLLFTQLSDLNRISASRSMDSDSEEFLKDMKKRGIINNG